MAKLTVAIIGIIGFLAFVLMQSQLDTPAANYVEVTPAIDGDVLILTGECRAVNMTVSDHQAISIASAMAKKFYVRPMTQDIMKDIFDAYGIRLASARIDGISDGIYTARMVVTTGGKTLEMDSRPTDAVGMAIRMGVPVLFEEKLLEAGGEKIC